MPKTELKNIDVEDIKANPEQPREHFDRDKLRELSESIKEVGLINPVTVRSKGKGYEIVTGERRWRAHQIAKIKKVPALVKEYSSEGQVAIESLIENIHRTDLSDIEKGKFAERIKRLEKIKTNTDLSKRIGVPTGTLSGWFDSIEIRKKLPSFAKNVSQSVITETQGLEEKERLDLIKDAAKEDYGSRKMREKVTEIKRDKELYADAEYPGQYERTANDVKEELNDWFTQGTHLINELVKDMNIEDLKQADKNSLVTSSGVMIFNTFPKLTNALIKAGAKADKKILELMEKNK